MTSTRTKELLEALEGLLTAKQYEAWVLYYHRSCSYQDIAYMLDLEKSTVRDRVKRADIKLVRWKRQNGLSGDLCFVALSQDRATDRAGADPEADTGRGERRRAA